MSDDWLQDDPFVDPSDPESVARAERRREREERRRAREAKRAKKDKQAPPPPPPEPAPPPRTPEQEFWDERGEAAEPSAPARPPEPVPAPRAASSAPAPPPPRRATSPVPPPAAAAPPPAAEPPHEPPASEPPPLDDFWEEPPEEGLPPEHTPAGGGGFAPPPPTGRRRGRGAGDGGGPLRGLRRHPVLVVLLLVAVVAVWFLWSLFQPFHGDGSGRVVVKVPKGASASEVGDILDERGVVDSSTLFQVRITLAGKRSELYAGEYELARGMSYGAAIEALSVPPVKRTRTVTIPEGYTRSQVAQIVEEAGVPGDYTTATIRSPYLKPARYGAENAKNLEGFLFPNTFELRPKAPVEDLVQLQLEDFKRQIAKVDMSYARSKNLTVYDVLIIASMIEREAGLASQRRDVAAVIYNRLADGMTLGIDATIRFATGNHTRPLTESELAVDSPYNTRLNAGLPPGPINSPGLAAIEAAAHPSKKPYLFYVNAPGTCGGLAFSENEAEFEADAARYHEAREAAGGNEPDSC